MTASELASMLAWLHPDLLTDALMREVDVLRIEGGLSHAERARRTAHLRERLLSLERQEEAVTEAAAAAGQDVARRPEASPLAVLGIRVLGATARAA